MRAELVRRRRAVLAGLLVLVVGLGACTNAAPEKTATVASPTPALPSPNTAQNSVLSSDPIVEVVKRVAPAVVNVTTRIVSAPDALGSSQVGQGVGTGFIIRSDGFIVTNFHVVEGALNIKVTLPKPDGRVFNARVVGGNDAHDLAILKINGRNLQTIPLGESSEIALGERVIALGYALALPGGPTVTSGIISALARTVTAQDPNSPNGQRTYQDALQTDAAINPGNSGGPLVDLAGNVVGINTAGNSQAENIGFSIAIDAAKPDIEQAIEHPAAAVAYLGVSSQAITSGLASQLGLSVDSGAYVAAVSPDGPAGKAGIRQGDVIVAFNGKAVTGPDDLGSAIQARKPGDRVTVTVVHAAGQRVQVTATLGVRPLPTTP
jgi:serine protease Do